MTRHPTRVGLVVLIGAGLLNGCTSAPGGSGTDPGRAAPATAQHGTRWWSNGHDGVGSRIDADAPATGALSPSRTVYCTMLRQTVARGQGLVGTHDDTAAAGAFLAEISRVAPAAVASSWQILDTAIGDLLAGRSTSSDRTTVQQAAARVGADAKGRCGVNLSRSVP